MPLNSPCLLSSSHPLSNGHFFVLQKRKKHSPDSGISCQVGREDKDSLFRVKNPRRWGGIDKSLATFTASLAIQFPKQTQNLQKKKTRSF